MILYLDTTAVVKLYVEEAGSDVVRELTTGLELHISHVTVVEFVAAVCRQGRSGGLAGP
ncbi:MAG: type II toxin-antitoxin system VapC family toxin [Candidatus Poribacteria bacterium]